MIKRLWFILLILPFLTRAQTYPAKPSNYVTDETGTLTQEQQSFLNAKLKGFEDSTSNQIFVYLTSSLKGQNLEDLSEAIFHNWKIGQEGKNNGVLIAIFKGDHKFRIQTGYGLEGQLPDLLTKRIQDNDMRPHFKEGNYYTGIESGIDKLIYFTKHTFVAEHNEASEKPKRTFLSSPLFLTLIPFYIFNLLAFLMVFFNLLGRRGRRLTKKSKKSAWIYALFLLPIPFVGAIGTFILGFKKNLLPPPNNNGYSGTTYSGGGSSGYSSSSYSSSSSDFSGGGGGDSGGGGSSSDW